MGDGCKNNRRIKSEMDGVLSTAREEETVKGATAVEGIYQRPHVSNSYCLG